MMIFILILLVSCKRENKTLEPDVQLSMLPDEQQLYTQIPLQEEAESFIINDTVIISENKLDNLINLALEMERLGQNDPIVEEINMGGQTRKQGKNFILIDEFDSGTSATNINIYSPDIIINGIGLGSKKEDVIFQFGDTYKIFEDDRGGSGEDIQYDLYPIHPYIITFCFINGVVYRIHYYSNTAWIE
jgi:hypothetical protein